MDRDALVQQITREVMARLRAETPQDPAPPHAVNAGPQPQSAAAPPPPASAFKHPNPADSNDRARSTNPAKRDPDSVRSFMAAGASRISGAPGAGTVPNDVASYIDHTLLKPDATEQEVVTLCQEAKEFHFASVCVNPGWVSLCAKLLRGTSVKVCTVIGFPLGATTSAVKAFEARRAIREGAGEIDMVINVGAVKSGNYDLVYQDIREVCAAVHESRALLKVIIETALLTDEEKVASCLLAKEAKADFVKTSTGFASGGATLRDVAIMRATVGPEIGVKASGGIRSYLDAVGMIEAGATRIGASAGVRIVSESQGAAAAPAPKGAY